MAEIITSPFRTESSESVAKNARTLINQFHILLRTSQIHDIGNVALVRPVTNLMSALDGIFKATPEFVLKLRGEYLYIDDVRVRYDIDDMVSYEYISNVMKEKKDRFPDLSESDFQGRFKEVRLHAEFLHPSRP